MVQGIIASGNSEENEGDDSELTGKKDLRSVSSSSSSSASSISSRNNNNNNNNTPDINNNNNRRYELRLNSGNGALFPAPNSPTSFSVMDANGQVKTVQPVQSDPNVDNISSGNTVGFPSLLGKRKRGLPTHLDYPDLNEMVKRSQKRYKQQILQSHEDSQSLLTEDVDQGPLAPAPKSLMEQAGWWEYLAILFGDAGDSTVLRLILHRLTKLAQLQLRGIEAARVQAATAFLAQHFKPLLVESFRDFVFQPDFSNNLTTWSRDPRFSDLIHRLVYQMDYLGTRGELDDIFGRNTSVAVSFGMRQPQWLRLKLIMEQIAWDLRHPDDLIGLWSPTWKLSVPQKLSILSYASNPRANAPLDINLPHRDLVMARINLITNGEAPKDFNLIKREESPLEQEHYRYALLQVKGNLCSSNSKTETNGGESKEPTTNQASGFKRRVNDYCELVNLTPNFSQFCQTDPDHSTPLSSLLSAANANGELFSNRVIKYVNHLERLYWAFTWVGSCQDAHEALLTLTNQVKGLGPRDEAVKRGKRVPSGVSESIQIRLEYMQASQQTCQTNMQLAGSAEVAHIFSLLNYRHLDEAFGEWERKYSSVAARLQGYPSGSILSSGEGQLLYQQARDVRIALLIYKYPKSVYVPCLSKGLLTRDPSTDLTLLNLANSLDASKSRETRIDPLIPELSARSLYMRALYLSGRYLEASREASEIATLSKGSADSSSGLVQEFLACTQLCGTVTRNPCEAEKTYDKLLGGGGGSENSDSVNNTESSENSDSVNNTENSVNSTKKSSSTKSAAGTVYKIGKELSTRLCRLSRNTASDALSLRYGKVLTTQATFSALKRALHPAPTSKLQAGEAESILPWFGLLPPAPVDEILSFVPTQKLDFVSQVSINGIPLIKTSDKQSTAAESSNNSKDNAKIMVLGKEYSADLLTNSTGSGSGSGSGSGLNQPRIQIDKGIFKFARGAGNKQSKQSEVNESSENSRTGNEEEQPVD